jgi:hypothetical protein
MRQNLRNASGKLLGWRQQMGRQIRGYAADGSPAGWYDTVINATYDRNGRRVGTGDLLASLIVSAG